MKIIAYPGPHAFEAGPGETVLDAALRQGLLLPHGCRDGSCGVCRGRVLSGQVDHGKALVQTLSEEDRAAGDALFCCARPLCDLTIECRDLRVEQSVPVRTLPAKVNKMIRAAPDVMIIELKLPLAERFVYRPGQYIEILLKDGRRRAFSLASAPHNASLLELHVRRVPGGEFTGHVFEHMKERDLLRFSGPHGTFYLRDPSLVENGGPKPMLLIAGGTGFAPIKAIVEEVIMRAAENSEATPPQMTIYWGGRQKDDLYLLSLAERWAMEHAFIRFVAVLSEPAPADCWGGRTGLVHQAAMQDFPDLSGYQAYVSGSPAMVAAARRDFVGQCSLPVEEFFSDAFEFSADAHSGAIRG
ncbi:CDP-6-deoxy-delta-3,4-glucoseen reductase [Propionivibrio limicola]|uniref:CDP-6-deoxy-delta-3,4-glucoseen reductase n=1 Tax=Propionivibrio limicola TaxID=167645 RepID=UPI0012924137|nr:CDP-6-deoxy-delta-3,4-glucoseen reductase [Propionivibrio limicola]